MCSAPERLLSAPPPGCQSHAEQEVGPLLVSEVLAVCTLTHGVACRDAPGPLKQATAKRARIELKEDHNLNSRCA